VAISATIPSVFSGLGTAWLGREDSNYHMVESKSKALPLGDAPTDYPECDGPIAAGIPSICSTSGVETIWGK
jgi:hypothetical protein